MADKKSREVEHKASKEALFIRSKVSERGLDFMRNLTPKQVDAVIRLSEEYRLKNSNSSLNQVGGLAADGGKKISESIISISEAITGLKAIQRESRKATADLKEVESLKKSKYLVIELDEMGSVPKILYKGEEVGPLVKVGFNWDTANAHYPSRQSIMIDHYNIDTSGKPVLESIRQLVGARGEGRDES